MRRMTRGPWIGVQPSQSSWFLVLTKKSGASEDENGRTISFLHFERRTEGSVRLIACPIFTQDESSYNSRRVIRLYGFCHLAFGLDGLRPSGILIYIDCLSWYSYCIDCIVYSYWKWWAFNKVTRIISDVDQEVILLKNPLKQHVNSSKSRSTGCY